MDGGYEGLQWTIPCSLKHSAYAVDIWLFSRQVVDLKPMAMDLEKKVTRVKIINMTETSPKFTAWWVIAHFRFPLMRSTSQGCITCIWRKRWTCTDIKKSDHHNYSEAPIFSSILVSVVSSKYSGLTLRLAYELVARELCGVKEWKKSTTFSKNQGWVEVQSQKPTAMVRMCSRHAMPRDKKGGVNGKDCLLYARFLRIWASSRYFFAVTHPRS